MFFVLKTISNLSSHRGRTFEKSLWSKGRSRSLSPEEGFFISKHGDMAKLIIRSVGRNMVDDSDVLKSNAEKEVKKANIDTRVDEEMEKKSENLNIGDFATLCGHE
ncbi:hypothetical protein L6452_26974 [Arctium lappa]|uniref:Uncharacterized protein n=1 Tax=Arctium lappa TaxID=4217 RepID=A0ACB8ZVK6_ARCLA|nr:hypothetical protein L6452_26974 [Arctium lappa]